MHATRRAATLLVGAALAASAITVAAGAEAATVSANCPLAYTRAVPVATAAQLKSALTAARPGDQIRLADGVYAGNFTLATAGNALAHVVLCGSPNAVLDGVATATGYTLHINNAPYTEVDGISVIHGQKSIVLDASPFSTLTGITVHDAGFEGVDFRRNTSDATISGSTIYNTGLVTPGFGEAIYVGSAINHWCDTTNCEPDRSDRVQVLNNTLGPGVGAEEVDIKEGTTGGVVSGNTFDGTGMVDGTAQSWVDVKGNSWLITGNVGRNTVRHGFTDSLAVAGWGSNNVFALNTEYVNSTGYGVRVQSGVTGVVVYTNNVVIGARAGVSTIPLTQG